MNKKIGLAIALVVIVGAIWYLEKTQVHPGASSGAPVQAINIGANANVSSSAAITIQSIATADHTVGYHPAIEIAGPTGFINASSSFTLKDLIGKKIILVDFWTYSCINCIRTLPYLTAWDAKYRDAGLVIVGVHTPEFDFEKDINNVSNAVEKYGIKYPVVLDSNYRTWQAYGNLYWPHEYLIDLAGYIVHDQVGEGNYNETEQTIQKLLAQRTSVFGMSNTVPSGEVKVQSVPPSGPESPETYFGSARNEFLANGKVGENGTQMFAEPQTAHINQLYLAGSWTFANEYATNNNAGAKIIFTYKARKVFFVADAPQGAMIKVLQDGVPVTDTAAGSDVHNGTMSVKASQLYNVINNDAVCSMNGSCAPDAPQHTLELIIDTPGLEAFTFTFG